MATKPVEVPIKGKDLTKPAFDSAIKNAESFKDKLKSSLLSPLNVVQGAVIASVATIGSSLLGLFKGIVQGSVESAAAADAAWSRVDAAVTNAGMNFGLARGQLDKLFTSIQKTTRYSDDDAADAFATLVTMTRDYSGSIANLSVVTDLAAARKISLADAATLVGKAMIGETASFARYGIVIQQGETAIDALRRQFNGFATKDAATLQGALAQVANAWDNVKEAIGRALTNVDDAGKTTNVLVDALNSLGTWIDENKADLSVVASLLGTIATWLLKIEAVSLRIAVHGIRGTASSAGLSAGKSVGQKIGLVEPDAVPGTSSAELKAFQEEHAKNVQARDARLAQSAKDEQQRIENQRKARDQAAKDADAAQAKHIADLKHEYDMINSIGRLGLQTEKEKEQSLGRQLQIVKELTNIATNKGVSIANRASAADFAADRADDQRKFDQEMQDFLSRPYTAMHINGPALPVSVKMPAVTPGTPRGTPPQGALGDIADIFKEGLGGEDAFAGVEDSLGSLEDRLKGFAGGTLASFFQVWQDGIGDVIHEHNVLGRVVPQLMRKAAGAALQADAQDTMLRAAKALALALTDPSGTHALQAGQLFAVGSAELAAAAALSGGGGGGGGGYGGGVSASGFSQVQNDIGSGRGKVIVPLPRGIDSYTPDELKALAAALQELDATRDIEFVYDTDR